MEKKPKNTGTGMTSDVEFRSSRTDCQFWLVHGFAELGYPIARDSTVENDFKNGNLKMRFHVLIDDRRADEKSSVDYSFIIII
jgi:hypothetical protein